MAVPNVPKAPAAPAPKVDPVAGLQAAKERAKSATSKRPKPKEFTLDPNGANLVKLALFGHMNSGKTFFFLGPLLEGERVFIVSTDFGGNGLVTLVNELKRLGRPDLVANIRGIDLNEYDDVVDFWKNPLEYAPSLTDFKPTVVGWEGISPFQMVIVDEYILSHAPGADKSGELRHAGFTHTQQDWQGMKRGLMRPLDAFVAFTLPDGSRPHKIATFHESKFENNEQTNKTEKGVYLQGAAKSLATGGFDVVLQCFSEEDKEGNVEYKYRAKGASEKYAVKNRGFDIKGVFTADPQKVWRKLTNKEA